MIAKYKVELVKEGEMPYTVPMDRPAVVAGIVQEYLGNVDREHFVVLLLDMKNVIVGINTVGIGALNATIVHPRELFKPAIIANSASIIVAHNHPSGDTTPSQQDIELTNRMLEAGKLLGIPLLDHIIIGNGYASFKEMGILGR